ncbi:ribokinase [Salimicrobium halophilum]|uniref:Ribokinase n=1 Tax=Salimicrobium halophilum TaxID=86666 RepID=A0A1G8T468_9BACI|nr:ribokinase [Salimicrobium halophilum]SDJ36191.1 ribokinase [Salimicrobium halophilum]
MGKVTVIGSINMDLVVSTTHMPGQGETVLGKEFITYPGGKGANQAVAAARTGAEVTMIGAVGRDAFGEKMMENLHKEGIDTKHVALVPEQSTGTATIILSDGDNRIIVAPGANHELSKEMVAQKKEEIETSDVVLMQLEIPIEVVEEVTVIAAEAGVPVILNPAPYRNLSENIRNRVSVLTPNESEYNQMHSSLTGEEEIVITRGEEGVEHKGEMIGGYSVDVVDTTGAGDTFNGVLAARIAEGEKVKEAIVVANAASALSVTMKGAQSGMPFREEVEAFLEDNKDPGS